MACAIHQPDSQLDLVLKRIVDLPRELVLAARTQAEHHKHWITPAPGRHFSHRHA